MDPPQLRPIDSSSVKARALEDARRMQAIVNEAARKADNAPPKYVLMELIGKGSFGRVYMGKDMATAGIVAVKVIDMDGSDTVNPRYADSYNEFLKEISALKLLSDNKARNINHIIDALLVGHTVWMVTEYCGGGSVATLMKPTPGGLQEKWIVPILREVAEALRWVHQAGIVHRDVKCANVLITEQGGVQLCDFGVAGIVETTLDKRSTFVGTSHWMAPELFNSTLSYGKEVDIWALGSMAYEIATGLPPNVAIGISREQLGMHFKYQIPRLEGGDYSTELRSLVAYCLEELPTSRPTIDQIQQHPYVHDTSFKYPTSTLSHLVRAFRLWEFSGGSRKSLFMHGGAQGSSEVTSPEADNEWNFSTTAAFDREVSSESTVQDVYEAYSTQVEFEDSFTQNLSRPTQAQRQRGPRRRPLPRVLAPLQVPLGKIFDPNTISNYEDNSRKHYGRPTTSDLPLRDNTAQIFIRDTMVDFGIDHKSENDQGTIRAGNRSNEKGTNDYDIGLPDFRRPALTDSLEINNIRHTQDWKFPSMAPPASADSEISRFPTSYLEPIDSRFPGSHVPSQKAKDRISMADSLIDLDMSLPDYVPDIGRPSTASSDAGSSTSEQRTPGNPFELESHATLYQPILLDDSLVEISHFPALDAEEETTYLSQDETGKHKGPGVFELKSDSIAHSKFAPQKPFLQFPDPSYNMVHFPEVPAAPSLAAMTGEASESEMLSEMLRLLGGLTDQLGAFREVYKSL